MPKKPPPSISPCPFCGHGGGRAPAPAESLDDRIARLKRELADAEIDKAGAELEALANEFWNYVPAFWREMEEEEKPLEEIVALTSFCREAWARFEKWRATARAAAEETAGRRPFLALSPFVMTDAMREGQKRPAGTGSIQPNGSGFQWRLSRAGKMVRSRVWPTRAEAEAELALAVADPTYQPILKDRKRLGPTVHREHRCSKCGATGHRAPTCPDAGDPGRRRPFGTVQPMGPGNFAARWYSGTTRHQKRGFTTEADAEAFLERIRPADPRDPGAAPQGQGAPAEPTSIEKAEPRAKLDAAVAAARAVQVVPAKPVAAGGAGAPPGPKPIPPPAVAPKGARTCSVCKKPGHNAKICVGRPPAAGPAAPPARPAAPPPPPPVELPLDLPEVEEGDEEGWSKPDADGRQTCVPCRGEGIDRRPGEGAGACCLNCDGEGYRWPSDDEGRRTA